MKKKLTEDDYCEHCEDNVYVESFTEIELMCDDGIPRPYYYLICEKCLEEFNKTNPEYKQAQEWRKFTDESCWAWLIGKEVYFNYDKDSPCYVGENAETFKIDSVEHKLGEVYFYDECKDRYGTLEYVLENLKENKE